MRAHLRKLTAAPAVPQLCAERFDLLESLRSVGNESFSAPYAVDLPEHLECRPVEITTIERLGDVFQFANAHNM